MRKGLFFRISALALALVLCIGTAIPAFATEIHEYDGEATSTVEYMIPSCFTILIPESINANNGWQSFEATELNIPDNSYLAVTIADIPEDSYFVLNHATSDDSISVQFVNDDGVVTRQQSTLAIFESNSYQSTGFKTELPEDFSSREHKAGSYSGTVRFVFWVVEL